MNRSSQPKRRVTTVEPRWLAARLGEPAVRVVDVRADEPARDASGPRLRVARTVDLRTFSPGVDGWNASRDRHPAQQGAPRVYLGAHVPGAVSLDVRAALFDESGDLVSAPELALAMSALGVGDAHTIVLVDDPPSRAALAAAWALDRYGHPRVRVLDGGFARWLAEGYPVTREVVRHPVASFTARVSA
jgi:thiosulfate/3-mercaptopyruvate sulfurtransferase